MSRIPCSALRLVGAVGRFVGRDVRRPQEDRPDLLAQPVDLGVEGLLPLAEGPALGLEGLGLLRLAVPAEAADLLGQGLDAAADLVPLGDRRPLGLIELEHPVERVGVLAPARDRRLHRVGLGPQQAEIDHSGTVPSAGGRHRRH
jgi:hypothetical protein